jgi:hypothetical protein
VASSTWFLGLSAVADPRRTGGVASGGIRYQIPFRNTGKIGINSNKIKKDFTIIGID